MRRFVNFSLAVVLVIFLSGCEWDSSGKDGTWSDSYSWINFSGLYRGVNGLLVGNFASTGTVGGAPATVSVDTDYQGTGPSGQSVLSGTLGRAPVNPSSVSIRFQATVSGSSNGQVVDNGSGGLSGSVSIIGSDSNTGIGDINYETGEWSVTIPLGGFSDPVKIYASYSYDASAASTTGSGNSTDLDVAGGDVATMLVEQVGNRLSFRDSNGNVYSGVLSVVALAGGDSTGRSSGDVSATFEVKGNASGKDVTISGSFTGAYTAPAEIETTNEDSPVLYGVMSNRILQGIWMQPSGTADVYGAAPQLSVDVTTTTTATPTN